MMSYLSFIVSFAQEWERQRAYSEADENLCGGDAGHPVR